MSAPALLFMHGGWQVATSAWTVAVKGMNTITICYPWSAASGLGFIDSATGVARVDLNLTMAVFLEYVRCARGGFVDLRGFAEK